MIFLKQKHTYKIFTVILLLFFCVLMGGCNSGGSGDINVAEGHNITGGSAQLGDSVNLKDIGIEMQGANAVINMSFIKGSRMEGEAETMISSVPPYTVSLLGSPARLKIELDIDYIDYASKSELFTDSIVYGMFKSGEPGDGRFAIYFQLNDNVTLRAEENDSVLRISLTQDRVTPRAAYFAVLDAFSEFEKGYIGKQHGLTPTMCEGLTDIVLISSAFSAQDLAQERADQLNEDLKLSSASKAYVLKMNTDERPVLTARSSGQSAGEKSVIAGADDKAFPLPVLIENGEYLCTTPSGDVIFYRQVLPQSGQEKELMLKYELLTMDTHGSQEKMDIPELYGVREVAVSPSGKYLAILENGISDSVLYVYNFYTGAIQNLGEEGFGDITVSFVWDEKEDVIYAMAGHDSLQLTKYDYELPEDERFSAVEEMNGAESKLAINGKNIYFSNQQIKPDGEIYCVNIADSSRNKVTNGVGFAISPNGRYLAAIVNVVEEEGSPSANLNLKNLHTGEEINIVNSKLVEDFAFDADSSTLYYTTQTYDGARGEYPYAFIKYNIQNEQTDFLGYSKTGSFVPSPNLGEIYIIDYFEQNDFNYPVTYIYTEEDK